MAEARSLPAARRFSGIGARAWQVSARARARAAEGREVIDLSIGDPDFDTPEAVTERAISALRAGRTHYTPSAGEPALRQAIAETATRDYGRPVAAEQVVVFPGAQNALFACFLCLAEAGDEVVLLEPLYATYEATARAGGADVVRVPLPAEAGFRLDLDAIAAAMTPRTKALLINSPGNPSGRVYDADSLAALAALCRDRGVWLVSDEVYWPLVFEGRWVSPFSLPAGRDITFAVNSLSKSHAMTGWRLGWVLAPPDLAHHLSDLAQALLFGVSQFVQDAAVTALSAPLPELEAQRRSFKARRDALCDGLAAIPGLEIHRPDGGMFLLVDVRATGLDGEAYAQALLEETGVALTPGFAFGPSLTGFVRAGFIRDIPVLEEAVRRIARFTADRPGR